MNFDADRLSRLSGLGPVQNTNVITESKDTQDLEEADIEECCGCGGVKADHDDSWGQMPASMALLSQPPESSHGHSHRPGPESSIDTDAGQDLFLFEMEEEEAVEEEAAEESAALTMETLRDTVLELRNEILEEQAEERQALAEAPARTAIRREIKALLAEMPADAATNWIYGKKGRPSSTHNKSRATAFAGVGFKNSKN